MPRIQYTKLLPEAETKNPTHCGCMCVRILVHTVVKKKKKSYNWYYEIWTQTVLVPNPDFTT